MISPTEWSHKLQEAFERLNPREKIVVTAGTVIAAAVILGTGWLMLSQSVTTAKLRADSLRSQLEQIVELQATFDQRQAESQALQRRLRGSTIRIVSHIEAAARSAGVEIGNMTPREGSPDEDGVQETTVEIRLQKLSITRLQEFLEKIESTTQAVVKVRRLRMRKRYDDRTLLDAEITIATYGMV